MSLSPSQLLQRLGSGIVPSGVARPSGPSATGRDASGLDFNSMLTNARAGRLETGLPVDVSAQPGLKLTAEQQTRLSAAIDRLTASDARHALVLLDGQALLADPAARRVTGRADLDSGTPVVGIDSLAAAPRGDRATATPKATLENSNPFRALIRTRPIESA